MALPIACDDNPVGEGRDDPANLVVNPSLAVVSAADTTIVEAIAQNRFGDPTLTSISFTSCDPAVASVEPDPSVVRAERLNRTRVIGGTTLTESCVVAAAGGLVDTAEVLVVPAELVVTSAPGVLRAGGSSEVVVEAVDANGDPVGPFSRDEATYTQSDASDDFNFIEITSGVGGVTAPGPAPGLSTVTATLVRGTATRSVSTTINVVPNVPAAAETEESSFGAVAVGDSTTLEVIVSDAFGNQNTEDAEILGVTPMSSDLGVATVSGEVVTASPAEVFVTVTGVAAGSATISGTVQTSEGDIAFGPTEVIVLSAFPAITSISPASTGPAATVTITGTDFLEPALPALTPSVAVGDITLFRVGDITVVSATEITATMATFGEAGPRNVAVSLGPAQSATDTWTQSTAFSAEDSEPANEAPFGGPTLGVPFEFSGTFGGGDIDDWFDFSVDQAGTLHLLLDWTSEGLIHHSAVDPNKDLDFIVLLSDLSNVADGVFDGFGCEGFFFHPEEDDCVLPGAGTYVLLIEDFSGALGDDRPVGYTITGHFEP